MRVNIAQLRKNKGGTENFHFSESFSPIRLGSDVFTFRSPLDVQLKVTNTGKSLLVKGKLEAECNVNCCRCLKEFPYQLSLEFEDEWVQEELVSQEQKDTAFIFSKDEFDIDNRIIEHILVHLPMKFICSENCKGLCPKCGADLNKTKCGCEDEDIDPRLEILSRWNKGV